MTLETLKGIEEIDGFEVCQMDRDWPNYRDKLNRFIKIDHRYNIIVFKLQDGPIKEGVNGCQVTTLIEASRLIIEGLNKENK